MFVGGTHGNWECQESLIRQGAFEQILEGFNWIQQRKQDEGKEDR